MITVIIAALIILLIITYKYPMFSLLLFLTTPLVKARLMYEFGFFRRVDWTVLCTVYLLLAMLFCFMKYGIDFKKLLNVPFRLLLVLNIILFFGLLYTSAPGYGSSKSARFLAFNLIAFLAPLAFGGTLSDVKKILLILFLAGIIIAVGTISGPASIFQEQAGPRAGFLEGSSLTTAERLAVAAIIALCFAMMTTTYTITKIISILLIPLFLVASIRTGSRGPFLGMIICWLLTAFVFRKRISKIWAIFIFAFVVIVIIYSFVSMTESSEEAASAVARISKTWTAEHGMQTAASARLTLFKQAASGFFESPLLGHGTGSFSFDTTGIDQRVYPHNIILELLYENGLIGGLIICIFFWFVFRSWRQAIRYVDSYSLGPEAMGIVSISGLLFTFELLQAMKSGDICDSRFMLFQCGLLLASYNCVCSAVEGLIVESEVMTEDWLQSEEADLQDVEVF